MRFILKFLLAVGVLVAAESRASGSVRVDIDLTSQTMHVRSGSGETYVWAISSGRAGYLTPRGVFRPRALYLMVHSVKYGNAPMPHSIFFYGEFAIHGTNVVGALGRPASHGCIRLSPQHAATLFAMVNSQGAQIRITGSTPISVARAHRWREAESILAFAPNHRTMTLDEWARDPVGR